MEKLFYWLSAALAVFLLFIFLRRPKKTDFFKRGGTRTVVRRPKSRKAYTILGIREDATKQEIIRAYKTKMRQYHPDVVAHKGESYKQGAREYALLIQKAKEELLGEKGEKEE